VWAAAGRGDKQPRPTDSLSGSESAVTACRLVEAHGTLRLFTGATDGTVRRWDLSASEKAPR
jgi:hypothetical protein